MRVDEALSALTVQLEAGHASHCSLGGCRCAHDIAVLRLPDALVLATADVLGATKVLTADRAWSRISRNVRVI